MSPPSRPSRAPQEETVAPRRARTVDVRRALVDAAWWVLEHDGIAGLTVRAVAARAGVAPMGVYNHFRDKDGLLTAVLTRAFDEFATAIAYPSHLGAREALVEQGRRYRGFALAHPVPYALMFGSARAAFESGAADRGADGDPDQIALLEAGARAFGQLVTGIGAGQAAGVVRADPPEGIAWTVWSAVHGAVGLESTVGQDPAEAPAAYEQVLQMVIRGVAPD